jgi:hypothetical protein
VWGLRERDKWWEGTNGWKRDETVFWGDTKPVVVVVCGAAGWRKRVDLMRRRITELGYREGVREVVLVVII